MSLAVLDVSRDQIMGNSGHLTRIFFRTTSRPADLPKHHQKIQKIIFLDFRISQFLPCFPPKKRKKGALKLPRIKIASLLRSYGENGKPLFPKGAWKSQHTFPGGFAQKMRSSILQFYICVPCLLESLTSLISE